MRAFPLQVITNSDTVLDNISTRVTVRSRAVRFAPPAARHFGMGFVWNRPLDVTIESRGMPSHRVLVPDVTRLAMLVLLGLGLLGSFVIRIGLRRRV